MRPFSSALFWTAIGSVAAIVFGLIGVAYEYNVSWMGFHSSTATGAAGASGAASPGATLTGPAKPVSSQHAMPVGTCLDTTNSPAPCDAPHAYEVVGMNSCAQADLLRYLGGVAGSDFLLPSLAPTLSRSSRVKTCLFSNPQGSLDGRQQDSLATTSGDRWRWCVDERLSRDVPCTQPHTEEIVGVGAGSENLDCVSKADAYTEAAMAGASADVAVLTISRSGSDPLCAIRVRGENVLTASLRHLGTKALPMASR